MKFIDIKLATPIKYRGATIYIRQWGPDGIVYMTQSEWDRDSARVIIPEASIKDGTYRTLAERRHMRPPVSRRVGFAELTRMEYANVGDSQIQEVR